MQNDYQATLEWRYFNVPIRYHNNLFKTASILGTFLVATTTSLTGNPSIGVLSIAILLIVALVFLTLQKDPTRG